MKSLKNRLAIMIGCSGLALTGICYSYSQTNIFGTPPAGAQNNDNTILTPDQFRQQVKQLNKETDDRLTNEARNILPPPEEDDQRNKRLAPGRQQQPSRQYGAPQQPQGGTVRQPAPQRDVYTGFGSQPQPQRQQQQQQPQPRQQPSGSGGGWNINY